MSYSYAVMRGYFTSVVFFPQTHNPSLIMRKVSDKPNRGTFYTRGPKPPSCGLVVVRGLSGTGQDSRRWAVGKRSEAPSAPPHRSPLFAILPEPSPQPPWKNCLPRNWSPVPKMLGTAVIYTLFFQDASKLSRSWKTREVWETVIDQWRLRRQLKAMWYPGWGPRTKKGH